MIACYKTLKETAKDEFVVQKSRFIGHASPVQNEEEAKAFVAEIRAQHKDATHNCYAYIVGENAGIMRYSDDGEPQGTAGLPMIELLKQIGVVNCAVVVTRYFGGILLGAGGLVRAYRKGLSLALRAAQIVLMQSTFALEVVLDYALYARFEKKIPNLPVLHEGTEFSDVVKLKLLILEQDVEAVKKSITDFCDAKADINHGPAFYHPWPSEEALADD